MADVVVGAGAADDDAVEDSAQHDFFNYARDCNAMI